MIRLGTRASALALAQAQAIADRLPGARLVPITTAGDRGARDDKSRFVREIESALLAGKVDLAVHSAKDVPGELTAGLSIVAVPERADPRDSLCGAASLDELGEGAVVGTASVRRRAQLLALRPDLEIRELRGNVDTRLRRLAEGDFNAIVIAQAGLERLGRGDEGSPLDELVPAPGQGCLLLEAAGTPGEVAADAGVDRGMGAAASGTAAARAAGSLTDPAALTALTAERALVVELEATCNTPVGACAQQRGGALVLRAFAGLPDGSHWIEDELEGDAGHPRALGAAVAGRLRSAGAAELLAEAERMALAG